MISLLSQLREHAESVERGCLYKVKARKDHLTRSRFCRMATISNSLFKFSSILDDRKVILICNGEAYSFTTEDGESIRCSSVVELNSYQEDTNTRVVLYCLYAMKGYRTVQVHTPDIFFILLHYIHMLDGISMLYNTGHGNKRRLISCQ